MPLSRRLNLLLTVSKPAIRGRVRCPRTIFKAEWPTKVDRTTLDGIDSQLEELWKTTQSDRLISLARRLAPLKSKCESSLRKLVELDQWLTIGRWAESVNAVMPEISNHGIAIKEGRHLLIDGVPDPLITALVTVQTQKIDNLLLC